MGYLFASGPSNEGNGRNKEQRTDLWGKLQCRACPLNHAHVNSPKMQPTGSSDPIVYMLGEAPGAEEDERGEQFIGKAGQYIRPLIPFEYREHIRWNNVIRDRPPGNRTPETPEIECCRPSIVRDIEITKPIAIFGLGNVPLGWALDRPRISDWRGRRVPIKIGSHTCWYYPMFHPSFIVRGKSSSYKSPQEHVFELDLKRAFAEIPNLPDPVVHTEQDARNRVEIVNGRHAGDLEFVLDFLEWAAKRDTGLDYETNGFRPYIRNSKILTIAVSDGVETLAFAYDHRQSGWSQQQRERVKKAFCAYLLAKDGTKTVHNLAFEMEWTAYHFGREYLRASRWDCSQAQAYTIDERNKDQKQRGAGPLSLDFLVLQHFGLNLKALTVLNKDRLDEEPIDEVLRYNGSDAKYHKLIHGVQKQIIKQEGLEDVYEMQLRRIPTVVFTQFKGVPVDQEANKVLTVKYTDRIRDILNDVADCEEAKQFKREVGHIYNPGSDEDAVAFLKEVLKTRHGQSTDEEDKGKWSSDKNVLSAVGTDLCLLTLRYRESVKAKSYCDAVALQSKSTNLYPDLLLHPSFGTNFTDTGRLSCRDPNMQNWPKRSEEMKEVRRQLASLPGYIFLSIDFSTIEGRGIAMLSRDPAYCQALWEGYDVHGEWVERVVKEHSDWISRGPRGIKAPMGSVKDFWAGAKKTASKADKAFYKWWRDIIKNKWTFALFFGSMLESVAADLGIDVRILKPVYDEWWRVFAGVADWQDRLTKDFERNGYVECLTGRRRRAPLRRNQIFNSPVQGTACDLVQDAYDRLSEMHIEELQAFVQIHDDLGFHIPEKKVEHFAEIIIGEMVRPTYDFINVPLAVDMSIGKNLFEMEEIGTFDSFKWWGLPQRAAA